MNTVCEPAAWQDCSDPDRLVRDPVVSVTISTYQHAPWISQAIEGVLAQRCSFPFELIIGEDGSTDGTREICLAYQRRHPETIRLLAADRNTGSKANLRRLFDHVRGRYHALCEGDDWWCDPMKLQDQVAFLEAHPECSLCFTRTRVVHEENGRRVEAGCIGPLRGKSRIAPPEFLLSYLGHTSSLVFRRLPGYPEWFWDPHCLGDMALHMLCMERGAAGFLDRITSVYRVTGRGLWSGAQGADKARAILDCYRLLGRHAEETKSACRRVIAYRRVLAGIHLGKALLAAGDTTGARGLWRELMASGDLWRQPRLWWKALKLAARTR